MVPTPKSDAKEKERLGLIFVTALVIAICGWGLRAIVDGQGAFDSIGRIMSVLGLIVVIFCIITSSVDA